MTTPMGTTGTADVTGLGPARPSTSAAPAVPGGGLGKDAFMSLLVSSMRYQDPSNPTDSQAYMAQLAQFAQVEKLEAIAASQAELTQWQRTVAGQGMLGRTVTGKADTGDVLSGTVTGVRLSATGPQLTLADGRTLSLDTVTDVRASPPA